MYEILFKHLFGGLFLLAGFVLFFALTATFGVDLVRLYFEGGRLQTHGWGWSLVVLAIAALSAWAGWSVSWRLGADVGTALDREIGRLRDIGHVQENGSGR